jgi:outer membrane protein/protease secretion system outer membrane protein
VSAIRKLTRFVPAIGLALATAPAGAIDLMQAYERALSQDAAFQATRADTEARREAVPQARAQLMPNISSNLYRSKANTDQRAINVLGNPVKQSYDYFSSNYGISLRQPLFRKYNFALYRQAVRRGKRRSQSRQEPAGSRRAHGRRLLRGPDGPGPVRADHRPEGRLRLPAGSRQAGFAKGQGTVIDVDDAQARYDMTIAQELEARQNLGYTRRALQVIVNEPVESLADLVPARMELTPPFPTDVEEWITARKRSTPSCGRCAPTSNRPTRNSPRPVPATINRRPGRPAQHERERTTSPSTAAT